MNTNTNENMDITTSQIDKANIQYLEFVQLTECVKQMDQIPQSLRSEAYANAYEYLRATLQKKCIHEYIEDYIDIDPDNGKYITYCIYCEKTLHK